MSAGPLHGLRVAIIGFGLTGRAVARALLESGAKPFVLDDNLTAATAAVAAESGVTVEAMPNTALASHLENFDLMVPSPGVPFGHPVFSAAAEAGLPVLAEIELAWQMANRPGGPLLAAVTGTNGKTTVTTLVTAMLEASGLSAVSAGNIGLPMIEAVTSGAKIVVGEVSSFQLQFTDLFRPAVSCWLNLAPDHLDWHPTLAHYAAAKARVWSNQAEGDTAVFNADDPVVAQAAGLIPPSVRRVSFSTHHVTDFGLDDRWLAGPDGEPLLAIDELPRALPHDLANALAAAAVALACGATPAGCRHALATTGPLPHRVGLVAKAAGVRWFDDSKATTPASVLAAVAGFNSVVLIAGGRNKGLDLAQLARTVPPVHAVVAIGEAAGEVEAAFDGVVPVTPAGSMESAVEAAAHLAREGDSVLLSPGCASFDWYPSYAARGEHFAAIVTRRLNGEEPRC
jgi:UDP-N-acetylmuramoylalanine--D-glutamate ligase